MWRGSSWGWIEATGCQNARSTGRAGESIGGFQGKVLPPGASKMGVWLPLLLVNANTRGDPEREPGGTWMDLETFQYLKGKDGGAKSWGSLLTSESWKLEAEQAVCRGLEDAGGFVRIQWKGELPGIWRSILVLGWEFIFACLLRGLAERWQTWKRSHDVFILLRSRSWDNNVREEVDI